MKIRLEKLANAIPALDKLSNADLSLKTLYWVRKLIKKLEPEKEFYTSEVNKLIDKYKDGKPIDGKVKLQKDHVKEFHDEHKKLLDVEIDVDITKPQIYDTENIKLSNNNISVLEPFVTFNFEEEVDNNDDKDSK